jgi:hypothetical protein
LLSTADYVVGIHFGFPFAALPKIVWGFAAFVMDFTFEMFGTFEGLAISFPSLVCGSSEAAERTAPLPVSIRYLGWRCFPELHFPKPVVLGFAVNVGLLKPTLALDFVNSIAHLCILCFA